MSKRPARPKGPSLLERLAERPESMEPMADGRIRTQSRRDFLLFGLGAAVAAAGAWWLLPDRTKARILPWAHDRLDTLAARVGLEAIPGAPSPLGPGVLPVDEVPREHELCAPVSAEVDDADPARAVPLCALD